jgi:hypothetical protein
VVLYVYRDSECQAVKDPIDAMLMALPKNIVQVDANFCRVAMDLYESREAESLLF